MKKILFSNDEIQMIKNDYLIKNLSCETIGKKYKVSKQPINRLLKNLGVLREGFSDGRKIILNLSQKIQIEKLYLTDRKNSKEISVIMNLSQSLVDKILQTSGYRRNKSYAMSILKKGKRLNDSVKTNMKKAQQKLSKSGNRKQSGGVCKTFIVGELKCQGTYEKFFIVKILKDGGELPKNSTPIITPFGVYYPDFTYKNTLVEVKSDYTYDILVGKKVSRFSKKKETNQYEKIKWVNMNVMPVDIIIVDKKNNRIIKKEIV